MQLRCWRRLIAGLGALLSCAAIAQAADFTGVYKSSLGILTLQQTGSRVIGAFSKYDGVLEGKAEGRRLTFRWRDGLENSGTGEIALGDDNKTLKGSTGSGASTSPFQAMRLTEEPSHPGTPTYWDYTESAEPPTNNGNLIPAAKGTAEFFIDGDKVTGRIAVRLSDPTKEDHSNDMEGFMAVSGTLKGNRFLLHSVNMADFSGGEIDLKGDGNRFSGRSTGEGGDLAVATLVRRAPVHVETLIEQAWARHSRLWKTANVAATRSWASPVSGDPRFAAMELLQSGKTADAAEAFAQLADSYAKAGDVHHQIEALTGEASALGKLGHYEEARQVDMKILSLPGITAEEKHDAEFDLQMVRWRLNDHKVSDNISEPDLGSLPKDHPLRLKDLGDQAFDKGDYDGAVRYYSDAITGYEADRKNRYKPEMADQDIASTYARIVTVELKRQRWPQAEAALEREIASWRVVHGAQNTLASTLSVLANVKAKQLRYADAIKVLDEAVEISISIQSGELWRQYAQRAHIEMIAGKPQVALADYAKAVAQFEIVRSALVTDQTKIGYFEGAADVYEEYVDCLMFTGDARQAFTISEKARSRALLDAVDRKGKALPADYAFPSETASTSVLQTITADEAAAMARTRRNVFLTYFVTKNRAYVWLIAPDGTITGGSLEANAFTLRTIVPIYRETLMFGQNADKARRDFTDLVSAPIAKALRELPVGTRLIVVPHKNLAQVPFAALGENAGDWGSRWTMTSLPSVSAAKYLANSPVPHDGPLLAIGDITPKPTSGSLLNTRAEIERAASVMRGSTLLARADVTRTNVLNALPKAKIILISTHTAGDGDSGELALQLSYPELLQQKDLKRGSLRGTALVILSACETSRGQTLAGDELINLARAFLVAGAERVVITLWKVQDNASAAIVPSFLSEIHMGTPPAAALQRALDRYRHTPLADGTLPDAFAWAPWVLVSRND